MQDFSRWIFYYRVSSEEQRLDGHALERYRAQGLSLVPEDNLYFDVESGASRARKGLNGALARLRSGGCDGLMVPFHSRLHRDMNIWQEIQALLIEHNLGYIDCSKGLIPVDLTSPEGEFGTGLDALLAQRQRREIQRHSLQGHRHRREQARFMFAPLGYRTTPEGQLEPNLDEYRPGITFWATAKQIIQWIVVDGYALSKTCDLQLSAWGLPTLHRDRPNTPKGLHNWLRNPALRSYFYNSLTEGLTKADHPPLLTEQQYQSLLLRFSGPLAPRGNLHPLAGLLFCSECGGHFTKKVTRPRLKSGKRSGREYHHLYCINAHPPPGRPQKCKARGYKKYDLIEGQIIEALTSVGGKAFEIAMAETDTENPEIIELSQQIAKFEAMNDPDLQTAIDTKKAKLLALQKDNGATAVDPDLISYYAQLASDPTFWEDSDWAERRILYRELVESVFVSPDGEAAVDFRFS